MVRKAQKTGEADSPEIAKVAATIKRKDAKDIASTKHKGLPMKKEELTTEAKVDKGRSDYGKATIRNYRRMGPGHGDPGMFDPEGKRGKAIDKRREEHKARRGVKGAKVPAYKVESVAGYSIGGEIKKGVKRHKDAVKKRKERSGKAVPYAMLAQEYVPEEGYDHWRDKQLEKGTWKEPERTNPPRKPMTKKELEKQAKNSQKALDIVKKGILKKYGKGAIMEPKTKKEEVVNELKTSTYHSYIQKASIDAVGRGVDAGIKGMTGPKKDMEKNMTKAYKRQRGINTAATKLARRAIKKEEVVNEKIKYDKKGSSMDYFLGADPKKTKEYKALKKKSVKEGTKYGLYKGDGKPKGAMAAFAKKKEEKKPNPYGKRAKLKMLIRGFSERERSRAGAVKEEKKKNCGCGQDPCITYGKNKNAHKMPDGTIMPGKTHKEEKVCWKGYKRKPGTKRYAKGSCIKEGNKTWREFLEEGNRTARQLSKSKTQTTGNIAADRGDDEKKNRESRKGLEKDLKKKGIGYSKGVGEYKYKKDGKEGTKKEVSYQTTPAKGMSKRRFGKVMRRLGRKYGQESVITKKAGKSAQLHDTQSKQNKADKSFALGKSKPGKNPSKEGETSGTKVRSGKLPKKTKGAMHYGN